METERSITIVFGSGADKETITLAGEKVGYSFDLEQNLVKCWAGQETVVVRLDLFLFIRQSN